MLSVMGHVVGDGPRYLRWATVLATDLALAIVLYAMMLAVDCDIGATVLTIGCSVDNRPQCWRWAAVLAMGHSVGDGP